MAEAQQTLDQTLDTKKQEAFDYVKLQLGEGIITQNLMQAIMKVSIKEQLVHIDNVPKMLLKKVITFSH
jgi:hypothetical protein